MEKFLKVLDYLTHSKAVVIGDVTYALVDDRLHWITFKKDEEGNNESFSWFDAAMHFNDFVCRCEAFKGGDNTVVDLPEIQRKESDADFDFSYMPEHDCPFCEFEVTKENVIKNGCVAHCPACFHAFHVAPRFGTDIRRSLRIRAISDEEKEEKRPAIKEPDLDAFFETAKKSKFKIKTVN
jgi:hypothetical protein